MRWREASGACLDGMTDASMAYAFSRPALARTLDVQETAPEFLAHQQETLAALHHCVASAPELSDTAAWDVIALAQGMIAMAIARRIRLSRLDDVSAIKAFAGEDYQVAVTYPDDEQFGLLSEPWVFQHDVETIAAL